MKKGVLLSLLCVMMFITSLFNIAFVEALAASEDFKTNPKIVTGAEHTVALKADGTVWAWGKNDYGQLGNGTYKYSKFKPVQVLGLENVIDIDVNDCGSIALKSDGTIWGWGNLGWISCIYDANIPVKLEGIEDVVDIALGYTNIAAVKSDGSVWTWGGNDGGELGNNDYTVFRRTEPGKVEGITDVIAVSALDRQIVALKSDGTVWLWGSSEYYGMIGGGCYYPVKVNGIKDVKAINIAASSGDIYMLNEEGVVWKLDSPSYVVDENKKKVLATQPKQIKGLFNIKAVAGCSSFIWAIDSLGDVWIYDELENGTDENIDKPVKVENIQDCIYVETGIAIKKDGGIWRVEENGVTYREFSDFSLLKVELSGITLSGSKKVQDADIYVVELGNSTELDLSYEPQDASIDKAEVQWTTSDSSIATVENGIVTGINQGRVTISATIEGKKASCMITVIPIVGYATCSYCNGEGKTKCEYCSGEGKKKCNICSGDGITVTSKSCTKCDGYGGISVNNECQICHGTKVSFSEAFQSYVSCTACSGTGVFIYTSDCKICDGIGRVSSNEKCITCDGIGQYKCPNCDNGYNECYSCSGEGKNRCKLYAISYDANGGTNSPYTQVKIENKNLQISDIKPVRKGYDFQGWALDKSAKVIDYMPGDYITDDESIQLYAVWNSKEDKSFVTTTVNSFTYGARTASTITLKWTKNTSATGYIIEQYKSGKWTAIKTITNNTIVNHKVTGLSPSITYKFRIKAYKYDGTSKIYSPYTTLTVKTLPSTVKGFTFSGRTASTVTLKWTKNTSAEGYVIQQYKSGKWKTIKTIAGNSTVKYKVTGLKPSANYKFRIKAYTKDGSTTLYSASYSTKSVKTVPSTVKGFTYKSRTAKTITLKWYKNNSADGYLIQQYKGGKWVTIKTITKKSTVNYKVTGLKKNTSYKFRIKAYKKDNSKKLYSVSYSNRTVKTLKK